MTNTSTKKPEWLLAGFVILICLAFAAQTGHIWEDYWITFRASLNLATGHGLVYTWGERLHTFTSPLGVLLPAGLSWLTGNHHDLLVLWLFRFISASALGAGLVLLYRALQAIQLHRLSVWFTLGLIALDTKIVDFTINGMEIGLLLFFAALTVHGLLVEGPRRTWRIGIGWAGLMWTRPDGCVYIAALGASWWLFISYRGGGSAYVANARRLLLAALVCAVLYLPWFLWAWWYYGSPVPHTIVAKGANQPPFVFSQATHGLLAFFPPLLESGNSSVPFTFLPVYAGMGGWPTAYHYLACALGALAALAWIIPGIRPQTRLLSLTYFLGNYYLTVVLRYFPPWYLPMVAFFGYLTLGLLFDALLGLATAARSASGQVPRLAWAAKILPACAALLVLGQLAVTLCSVWELHAQQALIENGVRRQIGLWLRDRAASSHDTVMLEPLGYIGYYSGLKMLDYPGLASREMVEVRKRLGAANEERAYLVLKPDWIVVRPAEAGFGQKPGKPHRLLQLYDLAEMFDATAAINAIRWLPGRAYLQYDQTFLVYHRKPDARFDDP